MTSGERGPVDENGVDATSRHPREGPIELRDGAHTDGQKLNTEFPAGSLGGFQDGTSSTSYASRTPSVSSRRLSNLPRAVDLTASG